MKHNKYKQTPNSIIDVHGYNKIEFLNLLNTLRLKAVGHVRIITGTGSTRNSPGVLLKTLKDFCYEHNISYNQSKLENGGSGAFEVFFI